MGWMVLVLPGQGNGYRLYVVGDLNGWVGDRIRTGMTFSFGVPGEDDKRGWRNVCRNISGQGPKGD